MEKYTLTVYRNEKVENPVCMQGNDKITYSVLESILGGVCSCTYTDHSNIVICHSASPYPVWIWCKDVNDRETIAAIGRCIKEEFPLEGGYRFNLSYEIFDALKQQDSYFEQAEIQMNLLSYKVTKLRDIEKTCDGKMTIAQGKDLEELAKYQQAAAYEMEGFHWDLDTCRERVREKIDRGELFLWRNEKEEIVALTARGDSAEYSKVGLVPILYTNADYAASNACYKKIGYEEVGSLCTVSK